MAGAGLTRRVLVAADSLAASKVGRRRADGGQVTRRAIPIDYRKITVARRTG